MTNPSSIYGLLAEFEDPEEILKAAEAARDAGYAKMDAYTPFPVEGLAAAVGFPRTRLPLVVLIGGLLGCAGGFLMQYWCNAINYPMNVGGRPLNSWPMFIPVTFEMTVLGAAVTGFFGTLFLNKSLELYHPVFNVPEFRKHASRDGFFLCIESEDPKFELRKTAEF